VLVLVLHVKVTLRGPDAKLLAQDHIPAMLATPHPQRLHSANTSTLLADVSVWQHSLACGAASPYTHLNPSEPTYYPKPPMIPIGF
jgi:hypothetical protein